MGPMCFSWPTYLLLLSSSLFSPFLGFIGPSFWAQLSPYPKSISWICESISICEMNWVTLREARGRKPPTFHRRGHHLLVYPPPTDNLCQKFCVRAFLRMPPSVAFAILKIPPWPQPLPREPSGIIDGDCSISLDHHRPQQFSSIKIFWNIFAWVSYGSS